MASRDEMERWLLIRELLTAHNTECQRRDAFEKAILEKIDTYAVLVDDLPAALHAHVEGKILELRAERWEATKAGVLNAPPPLLAPAPHVVPAAPPPEPIEPTRPFSLRHNDDTYVRLASIGKAALWVVKNHWVHKVLFAAGGALATWWKVRHGG